MNVRLTLVTTSAALLTVAALASAQTPTRPVPAAPAIAAVAPVAATSPVPGVSRVTAPVAQVAPVAAISTLTAVEALAAAEAQTVQSPKVVAATRPPSPKVVRPTAASPKVTLDTVGDDVQAPPPPPAPPVPPPAPRAARAPQAPAPPATSRIELPKVQATRMVKGQLVNLRLEFTITDQIGSATPVKKMVTMNVADGESGRIRSNARLPQQKGSMSYISMPLSIDASPELEGNRIRLRASLEYQLLADAGSDDASRTTAITQSVTSILSDGVQTILSQSADPLTDRKVTLEVKATIVK
ncbi:MAG: hypothetical protein NTV05_15960 [Acidobacteria bacterium]|nr:hypothetical protein [Acidobacteriota bacterium]